MLLDSSTETGVLLDDSILSNGIDSTLHHCTKLLSSRLEHCEEPSYHLLEPVFANNMSDVSWHLPGISLVWCDTQLPTVLYTGP